MAAAKNAYGPYTTPLPAEAVAAAPGKALRGSKALVLLGRLPGGPALLEAARAARVAHVVLLTAGGFGGGAVQLNQAQAWACEWAWARAYVLEVTAVHTADARFM